MEIDMDKRHWEHGPCPKHDCRKDSCKCGLRLITLPAALGDDSKDSPVAPKNGDYCNAIVKYEANNHLYIYSTEGVPTLIYDGNSGGGNNGNIVVGLENGMTTYPVGAAPISFEDALAAFQNGQSIFLTDYTPGKDDVYTVSAIEANDGIWSMKVEKVGMNLQSDEGFWVVKAHNPTEWRSVDFFKSVIDPATETQVEAVDSKIGDLEDLQTTDKDNVVDAINEIVSGGGGGGTSNFNALTNRPKYNDEAMTGDTNIPEVPTKTSDLENDSDYQTGTEVQSSISAALAGSKNVFYGTCSTGITTNAKVIDCADFTVADLKAGTVIIIKFSYYNTANFPTLNINNTGAVATTIAAHMWTNNEIVAFVHNGTSWDMVESGMATTSIAGVVKLTDSTTSTSANSALVPKALNDALSTMITGASPYSTSATYAVGDYCRNGNVVYQCNTAIVGGEAWDASHWDAVPSLQEQLDNTETWTFELEGGTTVTKKVVVR